MRLLVRIITEERILFFHRIISTGCKKKHKTIMCYRPIVRLHNKHVYCKCLFSSEPFSFFFFFFFGDHFVIIKTFFANYYLNLAYWLLQTQLLFFKWDSQHFLFTNLVNYFVIFDVTSLFVSVILYCTVLLLFKFQTAYEKCWIIIRILIYLGTFIL